MSGIGFLHGILVIATLVAWVLIISFTALLPSRINGARARVLSAHGRLARLERTLEVIEQRTQDTRDEIAVIDRQMSDVLVEAERLRGKIIDARRAPAARLIVVSDRWTPIDRAFAARVVQTREDGGEATSRDATAAAGKGANGATIPPPAPTAPAAKSGNLPAPVTAAAAGRTDATNAAAAEGNTAEADAKGGTAGSAGPKRTERRYVLWASSLQQAQDRFAARFPASKGWIIGPVEPVSVRGDTPP